MEERSNSPSRGNSKFERERKTKVKINKASDWSFDDGSPFVTGINKISLLI